MNTLRILKIFILTLIGGSFIAPQVYAESKELQVVTGVGVVSTEQIWLDADTLVSGVPILSINYGKWHIFGDGLISYDLVTEENLTFAIGLDYLEEGYGTGAFGNESSSENMVFDGYKSPDEEIVGNARISWRGMFLGLQQDLSNTSNGTSVEVGIELPLYEHSDTFKLSSSVTAIWLSEKYAQHLYGIEGEQIDQAKGRLAYDVDASTNYSISVKADYQITKNWLVNATAEYSVIDDHIVDSPLVGEDSFSQIFVGVFYVF